MSAEQRFDEIWLGSVVEQFYGCGIIVGPRHILTCNHVVRDCLDQPKWGVAAGDLVGRELVGRTVAGNVGLSVVANYPLPQTKAGEQAFDDLCLLTLAAGDAFPPSAVAPLLHKADCAIGTEAFKGQGLGETADGWIAVPFRGTLFDEIAFQHWHHTSSDFKHLGGRAGCSGAAAISQRHSGAVLGMMQGGLEDQVGLLIPAWHFADFLKAQGLPAAWYRTNGQRPSRYLPLRKSAALGIEERHLAYCDRKEQMKTLNPALESFVTQSEPSLVVVVAGDDDDLPSLFEKRFRRDGVALYINHNVWIAGRKLPKTLRDNYLRIGVTLTREDTCRTSGEVFAQISRSASNGALGRLSPDPRAIAGALSTVDSPALITVRVPSELVSAAMLELWRTCIAEVATLRANAPLIVLVLALQGEDARATIAGQSGIVVLPELPQIDRADIQGWVDDSLSPDPKLRWDDEKSASLLGRIRSDRFSLQQLQEWVSIGAQ